VLVNSSAASNRAEFREYSERCRRPEPEMGVVIPDPGQVVCIDHALKNVDAAEVLRLRLQSLSWSQIAARAGLGLWTVFHAQTAALNSSATFHNRALLGQTNPNSVKCLGFEAHTRATGRGCERGNNPSFGPIKAKLQYSRSWVTDRYGSY
jgi:hypothetical protein